MKKIGFLSSLIFLLTASCSEPAEENASGVKAVGSDLLAAEDLCSGSDQEIQNLSSYLSTAGVGSQISYGQFDQAKINATLAAVPLGILASFFDSGGKVIVSSGVSSICQGKVNISGLSQLSSKFSTGNTIESCWSMRADGAFDLYVNGVTNAANHSIVRSFGYLFHQLYADFNLRQESGTAGSFWWMTPKSNIDKGVARQLFQGLASSFENELRANEADSSDQTRILYGKNNGVLGWQEIKASNSPAGIKNFNAFAFSEAFDGFYCSKKSLESMRKFFPQTANAFEASFGLQLYQDPNKTYDFTGKKARYPWLRHYSSNCSTSGCYSNVRDWNWHGTSADDSGWDDAYRNTFTSFSGEWSDAHRLKYEQDFPTGRFDNCKTRQTSDQASGWTDSYSAVYGYNASFCSTYLKSTDFLGSQGSGFVSVLNEGIRRTPKSTTNPEDGDGNSGGDNRNNDGGDKEEPGDKSGISGTDPKDLSGDDPTDGSGDGSGGGNTVTPTSNGDDKLSKSDSGNIKTSKRKRGACGTIKGNQGNSLGLLLTMLLLMPVFVVNFRKEN